MTKSLSNLLKVGTTISKSERVIDYNDIIKDRVEAARIASLNRVESDGFVSGLEADIVERLVQDETDVEAAAFDSAVTLEQAQAEADSIVEQARQEADSIIAQANEQAEQIRESARQEGYELGQAESEQQIQNTCQELEQQYEQRTASLEADYEERRKSMEPQLVDALLTVFTEVTHTVSEDNKEIVLHLINNVLENIENSHEYIVKVSLEDYNFVVNNQGKIYCAMSNEVNIDVVQDSSLKQNECVIETDKGLFNCSLDVELNNLIKQIRLLSCI